MAPIIAVAMLGFVGFSLVVQFAGIALGLDAMRRKKPVPNGLGQPGVTVLRPVCGLENNLAETLATTFSADYPEYEILFCVAADSDPAIPLVRELIAQHPKANARLLIGDDRISGNPKLNNLVKGWAAARYGWVLMADSNVLLPSDYLQRLLARWVPGTGLVSSPPVGVRPGGFWARLECAFLNSYQARWQLAADRIGNGFAQGKILFWKKAFLDNAGSIVILGREMAEDVASTKVVRAAGLKVRLPGQLFLQPVGRRSFAEVWRRQLRWARVRRLGFVTYFLPEVLAGAFWPLLAALLLVATGVVPAIFVAALALIWYGAEYVLARRAGWPCGVGDILAWLLRDALLPLLWVGAWLGSGFEWRGNMMTTEDIAEVPGTAAKGS